MAPKFNLQSVLDYRHSRVEALEVQLARQHQQRQQAESMLQRMFETQSALYEQLGASQSGVLDLEAIDRIHRSIERYDHWIEAQVRQIAEILKQIEQTRTLVIEAKQEEEALVKLKEKMIERHEMVILRREERAQDDIYIARAFQRSKKAAQEANRV
jgi:flagellar export protein FliJ